MRNKIIFVLIFIVSSIVTRAQTSPALVTNYSYNLDASNEIRSLNDTITFSPFIAGTIITTQCLNKGIVFSGFNGSTAPLVYDFGAPTYYGRIVHSDNWFNALRMNFVDTLNANQYHLAKKIEFDNVVDSATIHNAEVDFMSIDVYDSMNVLIYHYLSSSPEHVVLNFASPSVAYITINDSANTAFVLDNILVDFGNATSVDEISSNDFKIYPNPVSYQLTFKLSNIEQTTIILYDIFSRPILQRTFTNSTTINTEQLANGIYFYELRNSNRIITNGKVVKI